MARSSEYGPIALNIIIRYNFHTGLYVATATLGGWEQEQLTHSAPTIKDAIWPIMSTFEHNKEQ